MKERWCSFKTLSKTTLLLKFNHKVENITFMLATVQNEFHFHMLKQIRRRSFVSQIYAKQKIIQFYCISMYGWENIMMLRSLNFSVCYLENGLWLEVRFGNSQNQFSLHGHKGAAIWSGSIEWNDFIDSLG